MPTASSSPTRCTRARRSRWTYVALLVDAEDRPREQAHLAALCARFGVELPAPGATHFLARLGALRVKWERHGEFSGCTFFAEGAGPAPFAEPAAGLLPAGWLAGWPGRTLAAAHAELAAGDDAPWAGNFPATTFGGHIVVGADIAEGAGRAFTDFRIHGDGFSRFVLLNRSLTPRQAGRMLQRLFEIEAYRMLALLALPIARRQSPRIVEIEKALAGLTDAIAADSGGDEALLQALTRLAAEVESGLAASQFRFGACRAYAPHRGAARRPAAGHPDDRGVHGAPLHAGGGHLRDHVAAAARPVRARRPGERAAVDAR